MEERNLFEIATRTKMRFPYKGIISIEDLWDLSLEGLDSIYKTINKELRINDEDSILNSDPVENQTPVDMISIIRHVVNVKQNEQISRTEQKAKAEKKQKLLGILSQKEDEKLTSMSVDDIRTMLSDM